MSDRVVALIDYQNVHGWARRLFPPANATRVGIALPTSEKPRHAEPEPLPRRTAQLWPLLYHGRVAVPVAVLTREAGRPSRPTRL